MDNRTFNLGLALGSPANGYKIVTRDGRAVTGFRLRKSSDGTEDLRKRYPYKAHVDKHGTFSYTKEGRFICVQDIVKLSIRKERNIDLFTVPDENKNVTSCPKCSEYKKNYEELVKEVKILSRENSVMKNEIKPLLMLITGQTEKDIVSLLSVFFRK